MQEIRSYFILSFLTILSFGNLFAQNGGISITGTIVENDGSTPIPYATVAVLEDSTKAILTGGTTIENGTFQLIATSPNFYIEVSFIGYETKTIHSFLIKDGRVKLGYISLNQDNALLEEVEIVGEKSQVEFKLDKRVFNVGQDISSTGMGALDVLNNVPSVNVDIEGQISLRGNNGVEILINGKPSVLADDENNALGTITADQIEKIEVITNPSAKYEAEGSAGIINIVLKKEEKKGLNGSITLNTGIPDNHSVGLSVNRRTEKFNVFAQLGAGYRSMPRNKESINRNYNSGIAVISDGEEFRNEQFYTFTLGTDYHLNENNIITLSGNFAYEIEKQPSEFNFSEVDANNNLLSAWQREESSDAVNPKWQYDLQYQKQFKNNKDHVLLFSAQGSFFGKEVESDFVNQPESDALPFTYQKTENEFNKVDYTFKLDYTKPLTESLTLEAGGQYEINDVNNDYAVFNLENDLWITDTSLTNDFSYEQGVLGVYATGAYEGKKWGVKVGLRAEQTNLETYLENTNERSKKDYLNFFPSVHTSYKINKRVSAQLGYSSRILRPRLWDLNPFFNIRNNYSIYRGNPNLQPQFTDSYELTWIFIFEKVSLNTGIYHLYSTDVIERVYTVEDNVSTRMPMNIGTNKSTGLELNIKYSPIKWATISGDVNYGFFERDGSFEDQVFDFKGEQWSGKMSSKFKLPASFDLEFTLNYRSDVKTVQGQTEGFAFLDAGIRKKLWKGKAIVSFAVKDIFATRKREYTVSQPDYYLYDLSSRGTFFTLGVSYGFGKGEAMTYSSGRRH